MKTVLVVEDDMIDAQLFCDAAKAVALADEVVVASDGRDALRKLKKARPTVIFLDLSMPGIDGLEVLKRIRADKNLRTVPVHMLSTSNSKDDVTRAYELGASAYMRKPDSFVQLKEMLLSVKNFWSACEVPEP